jgi:hypothetical protein
MVQAGSQSCGASLIRELVPRDQYSACRLCLVDPTGFVGYIIEAAQ